jgi:eukaryotic-like serine/threonine-protein kinase
MEAYAIISGKMLQIGDQIDQYQIIAYMAQGGMSDIYRGYDITSGRDVVIKVPNNELIGDPAQYERFQREMEVMSLLDHPVILRGLGTGKYNRVPYLVTEFINGQSLRQMIDNSNGLPFEQVAPLVQKIAEGMAYCHSMGVIHRDLKPENILITEDGQPLIMDFGLALTKGSRRVTYANLSATAGTPEYMAPEQVEGRRGDARTDVYALGVILFEMLAGKPPFSGDNNLAVMAQHLKSSLPRLNRIRPGTSPEAVAIVTRCLQRDPAARYQDMQSLAEALQDPASVDLTILENLQNQPDSTPFLRSTAFRAILLSLGTIIVIVILAFLLQFIRP